MRHLCKQSVWLFAAMSLWLVGAPLLQWMNAPADAADRRNERWRDTPNRFWAQLKNGEIRIGRDLREWHHDRGNPSLDGKRLFDKNNPLRLLRDTTIQARAYGAYVQFHNGDVLPGNVIAARDADPAEGLPQHLVVSLLEPLLNFDETSEIAVRPSSVARIVLKGKGKGPLEPGMILFEDGRRVRINAVRWATGGLRALTEEGFVSAAFLEISEIHLPPKDGTLVTALFDDLVAPCPTPGSRIGRIVTENAGVFTYRRAMVMMDSKRDKYFGQYHMVQPAWSLDVIRIPMDYIATRSYRDHDQIPLSSLNAESLVQRSFTGFKWQWRRNRNVRNGELAVENMIADLGIGMHAHSEVAFDLPPHATKFSAWVGIDNAVGSGGCVRCMVYLDKVEGKPAWQSDYIRGGAAPVRIESLDVEDAKRLVLVAHYAHDKRPRGTDPLDIRDEVSWLYPMVHVDVQALPAPPRFQELDDSVPQLAGWQFSDSAPEDLEYRTFFFKELGRWGASMYRPGKVDHKAEDVLIAIERRIKVDTTNAILQVEAGRGENENEGHALSVLVDGEPLGSFLNGDVKTNRAQGSLDMRRYPLGSFVGKDIELTIQVRPYRNGKYQAASLLWGNVALLPIVTDLLDSGEFLKPDVSITSLKPAVLKIKPTKKEYGDELKAGQTTDGKPLHIRGFSIEDGYAVPPGASAITYALDPSWKQFVAVIGLCEGSYGAGPFEIELDDKPVWTTDDPNTRSEDGQFDRSAQGRQVVIDIPPGYKTITLRVSKKSKGFAAWGYAGFTK